MHSRTPKAWTPLSYCKAKGKYGATEEKGIYPEVCSSVLIRESPVPWLWGLGPRRQSPHIQHTSQAILWGA